MPLHISLSARRMMEEFQLINKRNGIIFLERRGFRVCPEDNEDVSFVYFNGRLAGILYLTGRFSFHEERISDDPVYRRKRKSIRRDLEQRSNLVRQLSPNPYKYT